MIVNSPQQYAAVTPSDSVDLPTISDCLYIGVSGDVAIKGVSGASVVFKSVPVGFFLVRAARVLATGTTATNIISCI